jgi:hypothetical protein
MYILNQSFSELLHFSLNDFADGQAPPEIRKNDIIMVGKSAAKAWAYGFRDFFRFGWGASVPLK